MSSCTSSTDGFSSPPPARTPSRRRTPSGAVRRTADSKSEHVVDRLVRSVIDLRPEADIPGRRRAQHRDARSRRIDGLRSVVAEVGEQPVGTDSPYGNGIFAAVRARIHGRNVQVLRRFQREIFLRLIARRNGEEHRRSFDRVLQRLLYVSVVQLRFAICAPARSAYWIARMTSDASPVPSGPSTFSGSTFTFGATPLIPMPLFAEAAITPATSVPWKSPWLARRPSVRYCRNPNRSRRRRTRLRLVDAVVRNFSCIFRKCWPSDRDGSIHARVEHRDDDSLPPWLISHALTALMSKPGKPLTGPSMIWPTFAVPIDRGTTDRSARMPSVP